MMNLIVDFPQSRRQHTMSCPPGRRVSFTGQTDIIVVKDLSEQHKTDLWFTRCEMKTFKCQAALQLRNIESHNLTMAQYAEMNAQDTSAFMGLETYLSTTTTANIKARRLAVWAAVLAEQHRQREETGGVCDDPAKVARVSLRETAVSQKRARIIALIHADPPCLLM